MNQTNRAAEGAYQKVKGSDVEVLSDREKLMHVGLRRKCTEEQGAKGATEPTDCDRTQEKAFQNKVH